MQKLRLKNLVFTFVDFRISRNEKLSQILVVLEHDCLSSVKGVEFIFALKDADGVLLEFEGVVVLSVVIVFDERKDLVTNEHELLEKFDV